MICPFFLFFFFLLNLKIKKATQPPFSLDIKNPPFVEVALQTKESLKRPYFPLPRSILAGTNLIPSIFFFLQPPFDSKKIHPSFNFRENSFSFFFFFFLLPVYSGSVLGIALILYHWI